MLKKLILLLILLIPLNVKAFSTSARSSILMDMDSHRIIYGNDVHRVQSVASISKIMTCILAIENADIEKEVTIGDEILKSYGSGIYIKQGEVMKLKDLLYGLMLRSGNDAALSIAVSVSGDVSSFVKLMNDKAKELGMKNTVFNNPSGLDEEKGNFSSAYDMAILMSYAMGSDDFRKIVSTRDYSLKTNKNVYKWHNKNKLLFTYKNITGGKTGFTKIAKRTLVTSASYNNLNLVAVTLNDGDDWNDHKGLYEEAFSSYKNYVILKKGPISILNENYYKNKILYLKNNFTYPLLPLEEDVLKIKFEINKKRNYKDGDIIGRALVYLGDKQIHLENIYVKSKKVQTSFWDKLLDKIKND